MSSFFYTQDESARIDTRSRTKGPDGKSSVRTVLALATDTLETAGLSSPAPRRPEVTPPSLFTAQRSGWSDWLTGFWRWLWDLEEPMRGPAVPARLLAGIRGEFVNAVWDLQSADATRLRTQIERARSLRELWHLRADVFRTISTHRGQLEAQQRLDGLDTHFPVRASKRSDDSRQGRASRW
ncbi:hypothetical protein [uncultured Aquabacterium sp.]|jgi:hypothetical protein|uniref:hypothetical protein n=1 Tax=uncultured Aquabacterium sp. TaxID=158753 RepID=UPI0026088A33|nr:hypothetical protein [uncultured Aquabacterium sp.]